MVLQFANHTLLPLPPLCPILARTREHSSQYRRVDCFFFSSVFLFVLNLSSRSSFCFWLVYLLRSSMVYNSTLRSNKINRIQKTTRWERCTRSGAVASANKSKVPFTIRRSPFAVHRPHQLYRGRHFGTEAQKHHDYTQAVPPYKIKIKKREPKKERTKDDGCSWLGWPVN